MTKPNLSLMDPDEEFQPPKAAKPAAKPDKGKPAKEKAAPKEEATPLAPPPPREFKSLDHRKLNRKQQEKLAGWRGKNRGRMMDSFMQTIAASARKKHGDSSVFVGNQTRDMVAGIPCPSLAFEYVIGQDCYPLGLIMQLVAQQGVGKSALLAEIGRWFDVYGGGIFVCENETKFNPQWYESILGPEIYGRMQLRRSKSVEDWQRHLTSCISDAKLFCEGTDKEPGPGKTVPMLFGVDSIMGKMSEETQEKIVGTKAVGKPKSEDDNKKGKSKKGEGYAQARQHPVEAGSITKYMRTLPQLLDGWPFSVVLINHLRVQKDEGGNKVRNKGGGVGVDFQESFELEIKKLGGHKKMIQCADFEGFPLQITCEKNSFGPTHRKIETRLLWWYEDNPETGTWVQRSEWDWDWSTVALLREVLDGKASAMAKAALKSIDFHLECPKSAEVENTAWSRTLGMKEEDALSWAEVGAMIREHEPLMDELRRALRINRRPLLAPPGFGTDE